MSDVDDQGQMETFDSDEEELQSTQDALKQIESAWLNEKFAPEILPNKMGLIESIIDQVDYFEQQLKRLEKTDLRYDIHTMELSRIRFVISSYIRIRLEKIEQFVHHILEQESQRQEKYLTENELRFAREYKTSMETLFHDVALRHMPNIVQSQFPDAPTPNLNSHVVLKVVKPVTNTIVVQDLNMEDDEVELKVGTQHIIPYKNVAHLVVDGSVQLI